MNPGSVIANMFRPSGGTPATVTPAAPNTVAKQPTTSGNPGLENVNPAADPANQNLGAPTDDPGNKKQPSSPLDEFVDIFKIDDKKKPPVDPLSEKLFNFDAKKLAETVSKMNFASGVTPEVMQKIQQGDHQALVQVLNTTGQGAFGSAIQMLLPIVEQAIAKNNGRFKSILGEEIKTHQLSFTRSENKALQHPAAQPVLGALKSQIQRQFPELSPTEITQRAESYFTAMAKAVTSGSAEELNPDGTKKGGEKEQDFSAFLEI